MKVLIIGNGIAGMSAAIEAAELTRPAKKDISGVSMMAVLWFLTILVRRHVFSKIPQWPTHVEKNVRLIVTTLMTR